MIPLGGMIRVEWSAICHQLSESAQDQRLATVAFGYHHPNARSLLADLHEMKRRMKWLVLEKLEAAISLEFNDCREEWQQSQ
jgi:hypothetical protein